MTTTETEEANTVAVPVALIRTKIQEYEDEGWPAAANEWRALLPKPKPRLVAFAIDGNYLERAHGIDVVRLDVLENQPDLLTLLDEAVDEVMNVTDWPQVRDGLKSRIRTALGVTE